MKRAIAAALIASTLLAGLSNARATEHAKAAPPAAAATVKAAMSRGRWTRRILPYRWSAPDSW